MLKIRLMIGLAIAGALVLLLPLVAYAGWWWNSEIDVEGVDVRTIWTVDGGAQEQKARRYFAEIEVRFPVGAAAEVEAFQRSTERVTLVPSSELECKSDGIEIEVDWVVRHRGEFAGDPKVETLLTADGEYVSSATGHLNETIKLQVLVPAEDPFCS